MLPWACSTSCVIWVMTKTKTRSKKSSMEETAELSRLGLATVLEVEVQQPIQTHVIEAVTRLLPNDRFRMVSDADARFAHELEVVRAIAHRDDLVPRCVDLVQHFEQRLALDVRVDDPADEHAGEFAALDSQGALPHVVQYQARFELVGDLGTVAGHEEDLEAGFLHAFDHALGSRGEFQALFIQLVERALGEPLEHRDAPLDALVVLDLAAHGLGGDGCDLGLAADEVGELVDGLDGDE